MSFKQLLSRESGVQEVISRWQETTCLMMSRTDLQATLNRCCDFEDGARP